MPMFSKISKIGTGLCFLAGTFSSIVSGAPLLDHVLQTRNMVEYKLYGGNGDLSSGWPSESEWVNDFSTMFDAYRGSLENSCSAWNVPSNTLQETEDLKQSILRISAQGGGDARFILAIIIQESSGCVRAPTTTSPPPWNIRNAGLMQSHNGAGTCNDITQVPNVSIPCSANKIEQQIRDGALGTPSGDGLRQLLDKAGGSDASVYYRAARMYNSGSIDASGNLGAGVATHCYASDIANRLRGWIYGGSTCNQDTIAKFNGVAYV